jgi:hypothetical protein
MFVGFFMFIFHVCLTEKQQWILHVIHVSEMATLVGRGPLDGRLRQAKRCFPLKKKKKQKDAFPKKKAKRCSTLTEHTGAGCLGEVKGSEQELGQ